MSLNKVTGLASAYSNGEYTISWVNPTGVNINNIQQMNVIYMSLEDGVVNSIDIPDTYNVTANNTTTKYLTSSYSFNNLVPGSTYVVSVLIAASGVELESSPQIQIKVVSPPKKPKCAIVQGEKMAFFGMLKPDGTKITSSDKNTSFDGFSEITYANIFIVDRTNPLNSTQNIVVDISASNYALGGFVVAGSDVSLNLGNTYNVAVTYFNVNGASSLSDTLVFVPSLIASPPTAVAAIEAIDVSASLTGANVYWNAPVNTAEINSILNVSNIMFYNIYRTDVSNNTLPVKISVPVNLLADPSGVNLGAIYDASRNPVLYDISGSLYKYYYNDPVENGLYRYSVSAVNSLGESTIVKASQYGGVTNLVRVGSKPNAPSFTLVPSDSNIQINGLPLPKRLINGFVTTGKVAVKLWVGDASNNLIVNNLLPVDNSGNLVLAGLTNGVRYSVQVATQTASEENEYMSPFSGRVQSTPFKVPLTPTGLSVTDVSGGVPLNGQLLLSWSPQTYLTADGFGVDSSVNFILKRWLTSDPSGVLGVSSSNVYNGTNNTFLNTGLTNRVSYSYNLSASVLNTELNQNITSNASTPPVVSSPFSSPALPGPFTLINNGTGFIDVSFSAIADASANYAVQLLDASLNPVLGAGFLFDNVPLGTYRFSTANLVLGAMYNVSLKSVITRGGAKFYSLLDRKEPVVPFLLPTPPTGLNVSVSNNQLFVTWEPPANVVAGRLNGVVLNGYKVSLFDSNTGFELGQPVTLGYTQEYYVIANLINGQPYDVRVSAVGLVNGTATPVEGNRSSAINNVPAAPPASPQLLTFVAGDGSMTLNWESPTPDTRFNVFYGRADTSANIISNMEETFNAPVTPNGLSVRGFQSFSYTVTGLENGKNYYFEIIAVRNSNSISSVPAITTSGTLVGALQTGSWCIAAPFKPPTNPRVPASGNAFEVYDRNLTLKWRVPVDDGGAGTNLKYDVFVYDSSFGTLPDTAINADMLVNDFDTTNKVSVGSVVRATNLNYQQVLQVFQGAPLVNGRSYFANIFAKYSVTTSSNSSTIAVSSRLRVPDAGSIRVNPEPENVIGLTAVADDTSVALEWTDPSNNISSVKPGAFYQITGHDIYSLVQNTTELNLIASNVQGTKFNVTGLQNGTNYSFKVVAKHAISNSWQQTQQPSGADTGFITPFGSPIFNATNIVSSVNNTRFSVRVNTNGAALNGYVLLGIGLSNEEIMVSSGNASALNIVQVPNNQIVFDANGNTSFNGVSGVKPSNLVTLTLPDLSQNGVRPSIQDLLIVLTNPSGSTIVNWPVFSAGFGKSGSVQMNA
jgi:hypothetical protein